MRSQENRTNSHTVQYIDKRVCISCLQKLIIRNLIYISHTIKIIPPSVCKNNVNNSELHAQSLGKINV